MNPKNIYSFQSFSEFLRTIAQSRGKRGGFKVELASAMGSHPAYLSRVLAGQAQMSLEQADRILSHLQVTQAERRYLLLLLQEERADTASLRTFFRSERERLRVDDLDIKSRITESSQLEAQEEATYYSSWIYAAVHVLVSIPKFKEAPQIADTLGVPLRKVTEVIEFLERNKIIERHESRWKVGPSHVHLSKESPFINQHHINWRMKAVQAIDQGSQGDIRYSAALSLSQQDADQLKEKILEHLKECIAVAHKSKEERAYVYCFDFFELC